MASDSSSTTIALDSLEDIRGALHNEINDDIEIKFLSLIDEDERSDTDLNPFANADLRQFLEDHLIDECAMKVAKSLFKESNDFVVFAKSISDLEKVYKERVSFRSARLKKKVIEVDVVDDVGSKLAQVGTDIKMEELVIN
jgi:hypothetical protein